MLSVEYNFCYFYLIFRIVYRYPRAACCLQVVVIHYYCCFVDLFAFFSIHAVITTTLLPNPFSSTYTYTPFIKRTIPSIFKFYMARVKIQIISLKTGTKSFEPTTTTKYKNSKKIMLALLLVEERGKKIKVSGVL